MVADRPGQVVIDLPLRDLAPLRIGLIVSADRRKGHAGASRHQDDGEGLLHLRIVVRLKDAGVPAKAGIELVDQLVAEDVRVAGHQCSLRLRRVSIEDGIDRIGIRSLESGVLLKPIPHAVLRIERVIDLDHHKVFAVRVVQRSLTLVRASVAIRAQGTADDLDRRAMSIRQQREHLAIERNLCGLRGKRGACDRIRSAGGELAKYILLVRGRGQGELRYERKRNADAFIVPEEEELVPANRPANADTEFIHGRAWLLRDIARRVVCMQEVILRIQQ